MPYPGGKAGAGVYQTIINQIPPHDVLIEAFAGGAAITERIRPAGRNILIELDQVQAEALAAGFGDRGVEVFSCCGIEWLRHAFGLYRVCPGKAADPA